MKNIKRIIALAISVSMVLANIYVSNPSTNAYADELISATEQTEIADVATPANAIEETAVETPAETEPQVDEDGILLDGEIVDDATDSDALIDDTIDGAYYAEAEVDGMHVTVTADAGVVADPENTTLEITANDDKAIEEAIANHALKDNEEITALSAYDIKLIAADGSETEPDGKVSVSFANLPVELTDAKVYYMKPVTGDYLPQAIDTEASEEEVSFTTTHFSTWALAATDIPDVHTLKIDYYYKNGERIRSYAPYNGTYFDGDRFNVTLPKLSGYTAHMTTATGTEITNYKISGTISSDLHYVIIYVPGNAQYTVKHTFEQRDGSYVINEAMTEIKTGTIGEYANTRPGTIPTGYVAEEPARTVIDDTGSQILVVTYSYDRFSVSFNTSGGTYYNTVDDIAYGLTYTIPTSYVPTATGYLFKYWYDSADANKTPINPGDTITVTKDTVLVAEYDRDLAKYTIVYWQQDPNILTQYNYVKSVPNQTALVGTTVGDAAWLAEPNNAPFIDPLTYADTSAAMCKYFEFGSAKAAMVTPNNNAVLNIYFNRKVYKIEFIINSDKTGTDGTDYYNSYSVANSDTVPSMSINGITYKADGEHYTFEARLGQRISDIWPTSSNMNSATPTGDESPANPGYYLSGWRQPGSSSIYVSKRMNITPDLVTDNAVTVYFGYWQNSKVSYNLRYWLQDENGQYYNYHNEYNQEGVNTSVANWSAKEIDGFTNIPWDNTLVDENGVACPNGQIAVPGSTDVYDVNFYYTRNTYSIDYFNAGTEETVLPATLTDDIPFDKDISDPAYNYIPTKPASVGAYAEFICWNTDPNGTKATAYDFSANTKMPNHNIVLYAIWGTDTYTVTFETNGGTEVGAQTVNKGDRAVRADDPTKEDYTFAGWFTTADFSGPEFDFNTAILADTTVYAKWVPVEKSSYIVNYWAPDGTQLFPSDGPLSAYVGDQIIEVAKPHADYYPTQAYVSKRISSIASNNVFDFYYKDAEYVYYKVRYYDAATGATIAEEAPVRTSEKNVAYTPKEQAGYTLNLTYISFVLSLEEDPNNLVHNIIEIPCTRSSYTIVYQLRGGSVAGTNPTLYNEDTETFTLINPTRTGYTFVGWAGTDLTGTDNMTVTVAKGSSGNRIYIAYWKSNGGSSSSGGSGSSSSGMHATSTIPDYEAPLGTTEIVEGETPLSNVLGLPKTGERGNTDTLAMIVLLIITLGLIGYIGKKNRQEN